MVLLGLHQGHKGGGQGPGNETQGAGPSDILTPSLQAEGKIPEEAFEPAPKKSL